jgi:MFS family permease
MKNAAADPTVSGRTIDTSVKKTYFRIDNTLLFTLYAALSAFGLYTCIYAFRKTFAAATFSNLSFLGVDYKVLVVSQVCGYATSKFIGIKIIAELKTWQRAKSILVTSAVAGMSWLLFAIVPAPYNIVFLFTNGMALGLVWGMVFSYLEGRRVTEILGAALSVSFIFSSGLCRTVGAYLLLHANVSERWMPFVASCIFIIPLLGFLALLDRIPPPSLEDEALRTKRQPMDANARKNFITMFLPGIVLFVIAYMLLTAFRDFRDNFSAEVWKELGYALKPEIYTTTEIPIALAVLLVIGATMFIRNNKTALMVNHLIVLAGMILISISTFMFEEHVISPVAWMTFIGLGLYLGYVPFNSIFFDRMLAAFQFAGTVGFIMYVADAFGYLGSVGVLFFKEFGNKQVSWLDFFLTSGYSISVIGSFLIASSMIYFHIKHKHHSIAKA